MAASRVAARSDVHCSGSFRRASSKMVCNASIAGPTIFYMLQVAICWNVRLLEAADEIVAEKFDLLTRFIPYATARSGKATIKCHRQGTDACRELLSSIGVAHAVALRVSW